MSLTFFHSLFVFVAGWDTNPDQTASQSTHHKFISSRRFTLRRCHARQPKITSLLANVTVTTHKSGLMRHDERRDWGDGLKAAVVSGEGVPGWGDGEEVCLSCGLHYQLFPLIREAHTSINAD